ncbi:MAG: metalloregulator ArsR/SmtB family transcription factor [Pseudomonadota bacterium]
MVDKKTEQKLSQLFKAVSDETRRALLTQICQQGPIRVTELAAMQKISLNGTSKHLKVLESAGLIKRHTQGRDHWLSADLSQTEQLALWFNQLRSIWLQRLDRLDEHLGDNR